MQRRIVIAVFAVVIAITTLGGNYFRQKRVNERRYHCVSNLSVIDGAKAQIELEFHLKPGDLISTQLLAKYVTSWPPSFPSGPDCKYSINPVGQNATCCVSGHVSP